MMSLARKILLPVGWPIRWLFQLALKVPVALLGLVVVPFLYRKRYTPLADMPAWSLPWVNPEDWIGGFLNYGGSIPLWWKNKTYVPLKYKHRTVINWARKLLKKQPWEVPVKAYGDSKWSFYKYHAIRNPADGLRNFPKLQLRINKDMVHYWTPKYYDHYEPWSDRTPGWRGYAAWQNVHLGIKVQWIRENSYSEFKFGFRVEPRDAHHELPDSSARKALGASMATKLILNRKL